VPSKRFLSNKSRGKCNEHIFMFHKVVSALDHHLRNVNFPATANDISITKRDFFRVAGIPNCLGAVDGTLIPILAPPGNEEAVFVCRKGYHAINCQAVVDAHMR